ncbi:MAG: pirin family protein [Anaerolineae bacterium]
MRSTIIQPEYRPRAAVQLYPAAAFPTINPAPWLHAHFAVGGWSPLQRLSGMLTAHMSQIAGHSGFVFNDKGCLEIYTWMLEGQLYHEDTTGGQGVIHTGDLQRMFSGSYIEHKELNEWPEQARVIQIWFMADPQYRDVAPHYQQISGEDLPRRALGDGTVTSLIGDGSAMEQHMDGRLSALHIPAGGSSTLEPPRPDEDLFFYVTDGTGTVEEAALGIYDVILARPEAPALPLHATTDLHALAFYLPRFLN